MKRELRTCDVCGNEWDHHDGFVLRMATSGSSATNDLCSPTCLEQWAKNRKDWVEARAEALAEYDRRQALLDATAVAEPA